MSTMDEIVRSVGVISAALPKGVAVADRLAVLHCVSLYPTPPESANLAAIPQMTAKLRMPVGYSDHTLGIEAALVALALGARVIEKHFTLNKSYSSFRDHALSADPAEFAKLAGFVHAFDSMLGSGQREQVGADAANRIAARRSIVAARALPAGAVLQSSDLDCVRPADGLPPSQARQLIGRRLRTALAMHQLVNLSDVE
jgi:N-acetylneuraminate synthase/N,N'-diacetyllegionaminate synthase